MGSGAVQHILGHRDSLYTRDRLTNADGLLQNSGCMRGCDEFEHHSTIRIEVKTCWDFVDTLRLGLLSTFVHFLFILSNLTQSQFENNGSCVLFIWLFFSIFQLI